MGKDRLGQHRAHLKFDSAVLLVDGMTIPLGSVPIEPVSVVFDTDIKLPPRTVVSCRGRLVRKRKLEGKLFQMAPARKYSPEEEEVNFVEAVVEGVDIVPIKLIYHANKTLRISQAE